MCGRTGCAVRLIPKFAAFRWRMMTAVAGLTALLPVVAIGQTADDHEPSPYAGEESREIKSLSAEDIAELRRGGGWGLAKVAELNGVPGPAHLLELEDEIRLSPDQVSALREIFERMRQDAIAEGERLIARERILDQAFRNSSITDDDLRRMLAEIEQSRATLRYIHLSAHLATPALLTDDQIERYNAARGYGEDPCGAMPEGHDEGMWRRHHGCE